MIFGIKVGLQRQSFEDLQKTNPPFAEVWFNILKKDSYDDLFKEMKKRHMQVGLHFWGHTHDNIWTNIAYPDTTIIDISMKQIKETLEIAARNNFQYVNIHPSNYALVTINFETESFSLASEPADSSVCEQIFFENAHILHAYAKQLGVVFTLETIPSHDKNGNQRNAPYNLYAPSNLLLVKAATEGFTIANDFGHTACTLVTENRSEIYQTMLTMTKTLAPATRLLHLGFVVPPYNGTDYHAHLDHPEFTSDLAVPNQSEMAELLDLFTDRDDVWALVEPDGRHPANYFYVKNTFGI